MVYLFPISVNTLLVLEMYVQLHNKNSLLFILLDFTYKYDIKYDFFEAYILFSLIIHHCFMQVNYIKTYLPCNHITYNILLYGGYSSIINSAVRLLFILLLTYILLDRAQSIVSKILIISLMFNISLY